MNSRSYDPVVLRYLGYAVVLCIAAYLLYLVRGALPVFIVGALLAYALEPLLTRLEDRGYSRRSAVGLVFLCFLLFLVLLGGLLFVAWHQIQNLIANAPTFEQKAMDVLTHWQEHINELHLSPKVKNMVIQAVNDFQVKAPEMIAIKLREMVGWSFSHVGELLISIVIVPIITLWMMLEMKNIQRSFLLMLPSEYRPEVRAIVTDINEILGRYVRGQIIVCSAFGAMCLVGFGILGIVFQMQYGLALAAVGAFIYIIPYFGVTLVGITAGLLGYFTSTSPVLCALLAVGLCIVFNLILDYGVAPRVLGEGLGLHPLMVLFALLAGAQAGGIVGMILGVPVFASVRMIALRLFPRLDVAHSITPIVRKRAHVAPTAPPDEGNVNVPEVEEKEIPDAAEEGN